MSAFYKSKKCPGSWPGSRNDLVRLQSSPLPDSSSSSAAAAPPSTGSVGPVTVTSKSSNHPNTKMDFSHVPLPPPLAAAAPSNIRSNGSSSVAYSSPLANYLIPMPSGQPAMYESMPSTPESVNGYVSVPVSYVYLPTPAHSHHPQAMQWNDYQQQLYAAGALSTATFACNCPNCMTLTLSPSSMAPSAGGPPPTQQSLSDCSPSLGQMHPTSFLMQAPPSMGMMPPSMNFTQALFQRSLEQKFHASCPPPTSTTVTTTPITTVASGHRSAFSQSTPPLLNAEHPHHHPAAAAAAGVDRRRRKLGYNKNILYKTEQCNDFARDGICPRASRCQFAHGSEEIFDPRDHPLYKTAYCNDYKKERYCPRGDKCFHVHEHCEMRRRVSSSTNSGGASKSQSKPAGVPLTLQVPSNPEEEENNSKNDDNNIHETAFKLIHKKEEENNLSMPGKQSKMTESNYNNHKLKMPTLNSIKPKMSGMAAANLEDSEEFLRLWQTHKSVLSILHKSNHNDHLGF